MNDNHARFRRKTDKVIILLVITASMVTMAVSILGAWIATNNAVNDRRALSERLCLYIQDLNAMTNNSLATNKKLSQVTSELLAKVDIPQIAEEVKELQLLQNELTSVQPLPTLTCELRKEPSVQTVTISSIP